MLVVSTFLAVACASAPMESQADNEFKVELLSRRGLQLHVSWAKARFEADELVVYGKLRRQINKRRLAGGHVTIAIVGPDLNIIEIVRVGYSPRVISNRGWHEASFHARLPIKPPHGSMVMVGYYK